MSELPCAMFSRLGGGAESIGTARALVRLFLEDVDPDLADERVEKVLLVVSELVTNAVVHAPGPYAIEVSRRRGQLRIAVTDGSCAIPASRAPRFDGSGGFGLSIVEALTGSVEARLQAGGKTVSATLEWVTAS